MNPYAYRTTGLAIKTLSSLLRARVRLHGGETLPGGSLIFVINHFTRIETLLMPYHIHQLIRMPVWSLADYNLFKGALGGFLDRVGAVSTRNPDRDRLIVKSLLTGEAAWIIFPEGRMVKNRKIVEKGRFMVSFAGGKHPPHTGAAALALRTEFYRQRLAEMQRKNPDEAARLLERFRIPSLDPILKGKTFIVPVNITYFPMRTRENLLSGLAARFVENLPERFAEELMTEGTMLLSGVDVDVRFGAPIAVADYLRAPLIKADIVSDRPIDFDDPIPSLKAMRRAALVIMQRYMAAIYAMTTVNFDHLFAAMLRERPVDRISEDDLKRRVLYVIAGGLKNTGAHVHSSLELCPCHLMTDDRYGRYRDFIDLAIEKGVARREGKTLVTDRSRFDSVFDLHRVRIDNPVAVMANEIEPLGWLLKRIRRVAWMPAFWVRRQLSQRLLTNADEEYEAEYQSHYRKAESKPIRIGAPELFAGSSRKPGILLIHGYMAAPAEVRELAVFLARRGHWVYLPRLRGHGTSPEDLARRTHMDWVESVEKGFVALSGICRRVVVGGFSTGAGLALDLSTRVPSIKAVFAVAPPLRLQHMSTRFVPAVDAWNRIMQRVRIEGAKMEFVENRPENPHINYLRNPVSGVREIERLMEALEPRLADLKIPALVAQAGDDPVVDPKGSRRIFDLLGSEDKRYMLFHFDRHGILLGPRSHTVHRAIADFIQSIDGDEPP
ncbi:MAG: alpha/beta fold hydrolase [Desulfobacterales bacterium]|jgi:esterase/lipase/1-acyl-sn-glycerol-3-phosphate acyltransferase